MRTRFTSSLLALVVAGLMSLLPSPASATLVSIGPDGGFVPRALADVSSAAPIASLGDGTLGFNGGLVFDAASSGLFGIANDAFGNSQLYSFTAGGAGLTPIGSGLGQGFYGGLAEDPLTGKLYAVADDPSGNATLYAISSTGAATSLGAIGAGFYGGLAWAGGSLYAMAGDALGVQRSVYAIDLSGATATASLLLSLGDASLNFNGGLAYDEVADLFYTIGNDFLGNSTLYSFTAAGAGADLTALGGPFGQGFGNAGLAIVPDDLVPPPPPLPEPPALALVVLALGLARLGHACRRTAITRRGDAMPLSRPQVRAARLALPALLIALGAGPALAQYSTPMRDVDNADRAPYQESVSFSLDAPFVNGFGFFPTPAGKRYVIEFVSLTCTSQASSDAFPQAFLSVRKILSSTSTSGISLALNPPQFRGAAPFGGNVYQSTTSLKAYSDWDPFATGGTGGTAISLNVFHLAASAGAFCSGTITGHTVTP